MQKYFKNKLAMPVMIIIFTVALAAVGVARATTIGANISTSALTVSGAATLSSTLDVTGATTATTLTLTSTTNPQLTVRYDSTNYWTGGSSATGAITFDAVGAAQADSFTFADPVKVTTSTTQSLLVVNSTNTSNASTTLAVYQFGTGDIFGLYDGATRVLGVADGGALTATSTTNPQLTVKYDATNYWTQGSSATGAITFDAVGAAQADSFTFADPVKVTTSTTQSLLVVNSTNTSNASTTLAVYQFGTGDIFRVYDASTAVFVIRDGGRVGVGSSTPLGLLSVNAPAGSNAFVVGSSTNTMLIVDKEQRVGIGTTTPFGFLSVNPNGLSGPSFVIGSSSATNMLVTNGGRVGIATNSPSTTLSVGNNAGDHSATTTIDFAKPCFRMTENISGTLTTVYYWPSSGSANSSTLGGWATSTTSCF